MKAVLNYVRSLLGLPEEAHNTINVKRYRFDDDRSSDEEFPFTKRCKTIVHGTPKVVSPVTGQLKMKNTRERIIPIKRANDLPSTSTPYTNHVNGPRHERIVPIKLHSEAYSSPKIQDSSGEEDELYVTTCSNDQNDTDEEPEVTWAEPKTHMDYNYKIPSNARVFIEYVDPKKGNKSESNNVDDDDVVFVNEIGSMKQRSLVNGKQYYFTNPVAQEERTYTLGRQPSSRFSNSKKLLLSLQKPPTKPKLFKTPGIVKSYKNSTPSKYVGLSRGLNQLSLRKTSTNRSRMVSDTFDLEEKKNYQQLIKEITSSCTMTNIHASKSLLNSTQKAQKKSLAEIDLTQDISKSFRIPRRDSGKEYDPVTVASINSSDSEVEIVPSDASSSSSISIAPLNSFKLHLDDKPVSKKDWLADLSKRYQELRQDKKDKLRDASLKSNIISKVNHEQYLSTLEQKLKVDLTLPDSCIESSSEEETVLPEFTPEQLRIIRAAADPRADPNRTMVDKFNLQIKRRDLWTLTGLNWLNDEVINFYMNLLMQRSQQKDKLPKVYATNTFFYPKLKQSGHAGVKRWTRKVDIFAHSLLIVPVHLGVHWCMSIVDFRKKTIKYYDSMGGANHECCHLLQGYLEEEMQDKKREKFDTSGWQKECVKDIPQQMNGSDCGMFSCTFAEYICRNAALSFSQIDMPYLRQKMILEIVQGQLLL